MTVTTQNFTGSRAQYIIYTSNVASYNLKDI
jgi:hypothetical protein